MAEDFQIFEGVPKIHQISPRKGLAIPCAFSQATPDFTVQLNPGDGADAVRASLIKQAKGSFWFLSDEYSTVQLTDRKRIGLDTNVGVDVFSFHNEILPEKNYEQIAESLSRFYWALRDKSLFILDSIQIRSKDQINGKSGLFSRPVLIFKKLSKSTFMGIPTSSQDRKGSWYVQITLGSVKSVVILSQARLLDYKRLSSKIGELDAVEMHNVKDKFKNLYCP